MSKKSTIFGTQKCDDAFFVQKLIVHNGKVWEKAELHLKSAIPHFSRFNIVKQTELDLLKRQLK